MTLCIPALFLGPQQAPFYTIPLDTRQLHSALFQLAQESLPHTGDMDELELLQAMMIYTLYTGRQALLSEYTARAMSVIARDGWLDENNAVWQDLSGFDRNRARVVLADIMVAYK